MLTLRFVPRQPRRPIDTSALDGLAQLANSFYNDLAAAGVSSSRASGGDVAMADGTNKGKGREISHGAHNYNGDLHPSKRSRASMAPGPGGNMPLESLGAMPRSSSSTALAMPEIPPFKGKAPNAAPQHVEQKPSIAPIQSHKRTHSVSFSALPAEVSVKSKEDLKALMHVRKLLSAMDNGNGGAAGPADPSTKAALLGFMQGAAVVVSCQLVILRPTLANEYFFTAQARLHASRSAASTLGSAVGFERRAGSKLAFTVFVGRVTSTDTSSCCRIAICKSCFTAGTSASGPRSSSAIGRVHARLELTSCSAFRQSTTSASSVRHPKGRHEGFIEEGEVAGSRTVCMASVS